MSKIDYDLSAIRAIVFDVDGVLSPITVPMSPEGVPMRMANLRDGYAMKTAIKAGLKLAIITGADVKSIIGRFKPIGLTDIYLAAGDKLAILKDWMAANDVLPHEVAYVGDDIPDLSVLRYVGLPVCPADACVDCKAVARFISSCDGGYGVARELLEEIMKTQGSWPSSDIAFG